MEIHVSTLIWSVINFCILLIVLRSLLFKPILATLDSRKKEIEESLGKAEEARKQFDQLKEDQARDRETARVEAQAQIAAAAKLAETERTRILAEANSEASKFLERAQAQIEEDKERAVAAIKGEMASIAISAASKVIERNLTGEDQERLVDEFLKEVAN